MLPKIPVFFQTQTNQKMNFLLHTKKIKKAYYPMYVILKANIDQQGWCNIDTKQSIIIFPDNKSEHKFENGNHKWRPISLKKST